MQAFVLMIDVNRCWSSMSVIAAEDNSDNLRTLESFSRVQPQKGQAAR